MNQNQKIKKQVTPLLKKEKKSLMVKTWKKMNEIKNLNEAEMNF